MFFNNQTKQQQDDYEIFLQVVGSLSNLFTESKVPYLYYRIAERIFCKAFHTDDLSRSDVSIDAKKDDLGIGLKTFLAGNHKTFQKITEFGSKNQNLYDGLALQKKVIKIATLRNERLNFTYRLHAINHSMYHCITRDIDKFMIHEEDMNLININNITDIKEKDGSIIFNDGLHEYSFLKSKNTLQKKFVTKKIIYEFPVNIIENPLDILSNMPIFDQINQKTDTFIRETIFLPLYGKNHIVYERSGLNQWNAKGRTRDVNEVYIPIPAIIHKKYPSFFPDRDQPFNLKLPNGKIMKSKVCQDGGKALMSYSNRELGEWILRDVLRLREGELLTYEKLQILGIDSVRLDKIDESTFEINFASNGSHDRFMEADNS